MKQLAALCLATSLCVPSVFATTDTFTTVQTNEINRIVGQYLQDNPKVVMQSLMKLREQTMQKQQEKSKQAVIDNFSQLLTSKHSPVLGNANGDVTIVEFLDYRCGHCREMGEVIEKLINTDKNIKVVIKQLPIFSGDSLIAAKAALAVNTQGKFSKIHKRFLTIKDQLNKKHIDSSLTSIKADVSLVHSTMKKQWVEHEIAANMKLAKQLGLMGTPAFIIVDSTNAKNSIVIPGAASLDKITSLVKKIRTAS